MKWLLYILSISILLFSCRKEYSYEGGPTSTSTYYIKATIDGTDRSFVFDPIAVYTTSNNLPVLELAAFASADATDNTNITLDIYYDATPPGVGTYNYQDDNNFVTGIYDFGDPNTVYTAGIASFGTPPLTITITSIANNVVTGTFSGAFYRTDADDEEVHSDFILITGGTFRLLLQ